MNELRLSSGDHSEFSIQFNEINAEIRSLADIQVDFHLFRDGELRVSVPIVKDKKLERNSEEYAKGRGVSFSKWPADQAYFFIRDLCHAHQHHIPSVDTILILQDWRSHGDITWRNNVLYSLNHYIIRLRRSLHSEDLHRASGVSAYAMSFLKICGRREPYKPTAPFNMAAMDMSLKARVSENDFKDLQMANSKTWGIADAVGYRNIVIALFVGVVVVAITLMQPYINKHEEALVELGTWSVAHFLVITSSVFAIFAGLWVATGENGFRRKFYRQNLLYSRDFLALSLLRRRLIGVLSTIASIFLIVGVAVFLYLRQLVAG